MRRNSFICIVILTFAFGCATNSKKSKASVNLEKFDQTLKKAQNSSDPEAKEYERIDKAYREKNYEQAQQRAIVFIKTYPKSHFLEYAYHLRGLAFIGLKQYIQAIGQLKQAKELASAADLKVMTTYNLSYAYFENGQIDVADKVLNSLSSEEFEDSSNGDKIKFHTLKAKIHRIRQRYSEAAYEILHALRMLTERDYATLKDPMLSFLHETLDALSTSTEIEKQFEKWSQEFESSLGNDFLLFRLAKLQERESNRNGAKKYFERIIQQHPDSKYRKIADEFFKRQEISTQKVNSRKVGAVLTLSGKFAVIGQKALRGLELAFKVFQSSEDSKNVTLIVLDDQGSAERAVAAVDELVSKHEVAAIIGPISSKLTEPVAKRASEVGVPLITLTQKEASSLPHIFNAGLTPSIQAQEILEYATQKLHFSKFAVLAPSTKFGEEYAKAFLDEAEKRNVRITAYETYPEGETDFRNVIEKMSGLARPDIRSKEVEELNRLKAATPIKGKSKKMDHLFKLSPLVDFEAVFIPDEAKVLGQILPTFAYKDVDGVTFLGISTWHSPELLSRSGNFADKSIVVDGFYRNTSNPFLQKFIEEFKLVFKMEPGIIESQAYDAGQVLMAVLKDSSISSRSKVSDKISSQSSFSGSTGKILLRNNSFSKPLVLLTIKGGKFEEIALEP